MDLDALHEALREDHAPALDKPNDCHEREAVFPQLSRSSCLGSSSHPHAAVPLAGLVHTLDYNLMLRHEAQTGADYIRLHASLLARNGFDRLHIVGEVYQIPCPASPNLGR